MASTSDQSATVELANRNSFGLSPMTTAPSAKSLTIRVSKKDAKRPRLNQVSLLLALPTVAALAIILAYPFIDTLALAITHSTLGRPFIKLVGLSNFCEALQTGAFTGSLLRTTTFAVLAATAEVALGVIVALALHARGSRFGLLGTVFLLPMLTPPIMVGVAWQLLLAPAGGGLSGLWSLFGKPGFNAFGTGLSAFLSLAVIEVWQWVPFVTLLTYVALLGVEREQLEAAMIDGAGLWRRFTAVIYPTIAPILLSLLLMRLLGSFKTFDVAYVITQGGPGFSTTFTAVDFR